MAERRNVTTVLFGGVVWLAAAGPAWRRGLGAGPIEPLFLLAPLVVVPLALALARGRATCSERPLLGWAGRLHPMAAAGVCASFLLPPGPLAGALASGWLVLAGLLALDGLVMLVRLRPWRAEEVALRAAALFLPVGAGWMVLSRAGGGALGFGEPLVLLTAVHFHYAGFATSVLAGFAGRALARRSAPRLLRAGMVAGVLFGTPLLAVGISFSPVAEVAAASLLALTLAGLALAQVVLIAPVQPRLARILFAGSALSLLGGMALAVVYATGEYLRDQPLAIPRMVALHGVANAVGFSLLGLLGWAVAGPPPATSGGGPCTGR